MNPIREYYEQMTKGGLVVCKKIERVYAEQMRKLDDAESEYYFDEKRAQHVIGFFERYLRHSKGSLRGQTVKLELWQRAMLASAYGWVDINGNRQYQRVVLIVAKKNGKSFMASGLGLYHLMADGEGGPEVYSVATKRDQAKIIWSEARRMRNQAPALKKRIRAVVSGLYYDDADGVFSPQASEANTMDGLNISCALMDEFHQWRHGRALYNIIADGISSRGDR